MDRRFLWTESLWIVAHWLQELSFKTARVFVEWTHSELFATGDALQCYQATYAFRSGTSSSRSHLDLLYRFCFWRKEARNMWLLRSYPVSTSHVNLLKPSQNHLKTQLDRPVPRWRPPLVPELLLLTRINAREDVSSVPSLWKNIFLLSYLYLPWAILQCAGKHHWHFPVGTMFIFDDLHCS